MAPSYGSDFSRSCHVMQCAANGRRREMGRGGWICLGTERGRPERLTCTDGQTFGMRGTKGLSTQYHEC